MLLWLRFFDKPTRGVPEAINMEAKQHGGQRPGGLEDRLRGVLRKKQYSLKGEAGLVCQLIYGCGLRIAEALSLRVKDVHLGAGNLEVRGGKGDKDRTMTLPKTLLEPLRVHLEKVRRWYEADRCEERPGVMLPHAMVEKN